MNAKKENYYRTAESPNDAALLSRKPLLCTMRLQQEGINLLYLRMTINYHSV